MKIISFQASETSSAAETLRREVRDFVARELPGRTPEQRARSWNDFDPEFSRKLGARGWIGMTLPKQYGGSERSQLERYVVIEELLAAGAPLSAHWVADRQSGPLLLRHGTDEQKQAVLPRITRGEAHFCIGMSEPDSGSDLGSVKTRAVKVDGGYRINGTKLWTSNGHRAHFMILLARTAVDADNKRNGLTQFLVDMSLPGIEVRPIIDLSGKHHFNEVRFNDLYLPDSAVIGTAGEGWKQVMGELALERSSPERFLSAFALLVELVRACGEEPGEKAAEAIGRLVGHIYILRRLSRSIAAMIEKGENPALQAALVKDLGTALEQETPETARLIVEVEAAAQVNPHLQGVLRHIVLNAPSYSIRGGTREIMRSMIARAIIEELHAS